MEVAFLDGKKPATISVSRHARAVLFSRAPPLPGRRMIRYGASVAWAPA
jgi:hypothetical protein